MKGSPSEIEGAARAMTFPQVEGKEQSGHRLSGPPRKYYRLTPAGRAAFAAQKREWRTFTDAVNQLLGER